MPKTIYSIKRSLDIAARTIQRTNKKLMQLIPELDFKGNKLGEPGFFVQADEAMLNFKCKSQWGRSPLSKSKAFCIVEVREKITRDFATLLEGKKSNQLFI